MVGIVRSERKSVNMVCHVIFEVNAFFAYGAQLSRFGDEHDEEGEEADADEAEAETGGTVRLVEDQGG